MAYQREGRGRLGEGEEGSNNFSRLMFAMFATAKVVFGSKRFRKFLDRRLSSRCEL